MILVDVDLFVMGRGVIVPMVYWVVVTTHILVVVVMATPSVTIASGANYIVFVVASAEVLIEHSTVGTCRKSLVKFVCVLSR